MRVSILLIALSLIFATCKKDSVIDRRGAMFLVRGRGTSFLYPTGTSDGTGEHTICWFYKDNNLFHSVDAGTISYGDSTLKDVGGFIYQGPGNEPGTGSGLLSAGRAWKVSGSQAGGVPAITTNAPPSFPSVLTTEFSSLREIDRTQPFTISWDNSVPADSVEIRINGSNGKVVTSGMILGNKSSYTFTASQLTVLDPSIKFTSPGIAITNDSVMITALIVNKPTVSGVPLEIFNQAQRSVTVLVK